MHNVIPRMRYVSGKKGISGELYTRSYPDGTCWGVWARQLVGLNKINYHNSTSEGNGACAIGLPVRWICNPLHLHRADL